MPMWEIPVKINSSGRLIMQGPSAEAVIEILSRTSEKKIKGHVCDVVSFVKVQKDSIRRINEKGDFFDADSPTDRLSGDEQAVAEYRSVTSDVGEHSPGDKPPVVEEEHGGDDKSPESVGEVQSAETASQVAQSMDSDGPPRVGGDEVQADEADPVQDNQQPEPPSTDRTRE